MGVPVLTLAGHTFFARQGAALLTHAGLPDWIAADADGYVARAVRHAADLAALAALRQRGCGRRCSLRRCSMHRDSPRTWRRLRAMWQRWCAKGVRGRGVHFAG
ncbi:MAG: hypothetical protein U1F67_13680 [Rubrivivax sp.]